MWSAGGGWGGDGRKGVTGLASGRDEGEESAKDVEGEERGKTMRKGRKRRDAGRKVEEEEERSRKKIKIERERHTMISKRRKRRDTGR